MDLFCNCLELLDRVELRGAKMDRESLSFILAMFFIASHITSTKHFSRPKKFFVFCILF